MASGANAATWFAYELATGKRLAKHTLQTGGNLLVQDGVLVVSGQGRLAVYGVR